MKPDSAGSAGQLKNSIVLLDDHRRTFVFSPLRLMITLVLCIFIVETLIMIILEGLEPPVWMEILLDSSILTATLFTILYYNMFKPLVVLTKEYRLKEIRLKNNQEHLEQKVQERTAELNTTYLNLKAENEKAIMAKSALRESEYRFRQLFEQSEDAIVLLSPQDNGIIDVNPTAERIFRKQRSELLAGGLAALIGPEGYQHLESAFELILQDNFPGIEKFEYTPVPGEVQILSFRGKKISLQGSTVIYTTFRDITARIRLEEQALEIQGRLIQANRMTSLGQLVASVAHELNNPNNYILMNATLLQKTWKDIHTVLRERYEQEGEFMLGQITFTEAAGFLPDIYDGIADGARRISEIVDTLKDYSRDDRGGLDGLVDINAVVRLSVSILNHHISRTTRRFSLELGNDLPLVRGSVRQLEQVVINLIANALQSLPDPDHGVDVSTSLEADGEHVVIKVTDQGNGIPDEIASRVMEPFFTTRLDRGGTGLGLSICGNIVRDHNGTIGFESTPGKGTAFSVRLRRTVPDENDTQEAEA